MVRYISPILPHVHFRWNEYANEGFMEKGFSDAQEVGAKGTVEQPNPTPALTTEETIRGRMSIAQELGEIYGVEHRCHIGLTNEEDQVRAAYRLAMDRNFPYAESIKGFDGHSTGNMGILDPAVRRRNWMLAGSRKGCDFRGVVMKHNEMEEQYAGVLDLSDPITHSYKQNEGAEVAATLENLRNAYDAGFRGIFYIAHASSPETIELVEFERERMPFRIVVETTGHHEFLNWNHYPLDGLSIKMNPPLRSPKNQERVLEYVIDGKTDIIGDDHAPHTLIKKSEGASGIPAIGFLPKRIELLRELGIDESHLERLLFTTANELFFRGELTPSTVEVEYNPEIWSKYGWNPFRQIDGTL